MLSERSKIGDRVVHDDNRSNNPVVFTNVGLPAVSGKGNVMKPVYLIFAILSAVPGWAALNVPLTVQEALYSGGSTGVARTNEPFCMGVPLAESSGVTNTGVLGLSGATAGQFRVLGRWPSGNDKWVKVCGILPSLSAGGTAVVTLTDGGGNFGGADLATDNGATITVATGAATFTIKKANFNGVDVVDIGSTHVVASSTSATRGLVLVGPDPTSNTVAGKTTCAPDAGGSACNTIYSSANDPNSTCTIEENGPVMTGIKCIGTHFDNAAHPYMHFTARMYFYKGKSTVKATVSLRNADYASAAPGQPIRRLQCVRRQLHRFDVQHRIQGREVLRAANCPQRKRPDYV